MDPRHAEAPIPAEQSRDTPISKPSERFLIALILLRSTFIPQRFRSISCPNAFNHQIKTFTSSLTPSIQASRVARFGDDRAPIRHERMCQTFPCPTENGRKPVCQRSTVYV